MEEVDITQSGDSKLKEPCRSTRDVLLAAPKVELHVHLDGSFSTPILFTAAKKYIDELPEEVRTPWDGKLIRVRDAIRNCGEDLGKFEALVTVGSEVRGLFPILDCFYIFLPIVRGRFELLEQLAYEFCRGQADQNIIYTEVRYSPHEFLQQGVDGKCVDGASAADAVQAVSRGLARAQKDFAVVVRQILCCIAAQPSWSEETAQLASEYAHLGIVGVDIASGEMHFEDVNLRSAHASALESAKSKGLGVTVHAGENGPGENVAAAMTVYGACRIGHGYRSVGTEACRQAEAHGVHYELCPTSSVSTCAVSCDWEDHPICKLCNESPASCSISSDDPSIFRVTLTDELVTCVEKMGLSFENIKTMTLQALVKAFKLEPDLFNNLCSKIVKFYDEIL